ncbi:FAD-dependent oxidoreductase [Christensenellaceae bacterium OttesenSCG-928-K19]|nr:FAD-dependent oxidoreductase [Christensenellaceae bacterium OttesenSCG-928-K19]
MAKTIIVGSGPSGLIAAHTLAREGYEDFLILEKLDRIGGRIESYETPQGKFIDVAAQLVHPGYKMAKTIIEELGLSDQLVQSSMMKQRFYDESQDTMVYNNPPEDNPEAIEQQKKWMDAMGGENFKAFVDWCRDRCADGKMYEGEVTWGLDVDEDEFAAYVEKRFGKEVLERFVQPIISAVALTFPERISTLYGLQIAWTVLVGNVAVMNSGLEAVIQKLKEEFGEDRYKVNSEVTEIVVENGVTKGVRTINGDFYECENVICAVEAPTAIKIIPAMPKEMKDAVATVKYSKVMTVLTFTDKMPIDFNVFGTGCMFNRRTREKYDLPFGVVGFKSARAPKAVPPGKECTSLFIFDKTADEMWDWPDEKIEEKVLSSLRKMFDFYPKEIDGYYIARYPFGNNIMPPGSATAMNELRLNHYQDIKNLYLAGDYLFTSSYESGFYTGRRVAYAMLEKKDQLV